MPLNFKMSELIHSDTAAKYNINNMPDINSLDNMLILIIDCLQPIRELLGKAVFINSGYRCSQLNKLVGGSPTSEHLKGMACDFHCYGLYPKQIVKLIKNSDIQYTQLIEEHSKNKSWVHISYNKDDLKRETLLYINGKYAKI